MAVGTVQQTDLQVAHAEGQGFWGKIAHILGSARELIDVYFGSPARLELLDSEYRASLSVKERAMIDAHLHSIWIN